MNTERKERIYAYIKSPEYIPLKLKELTIVLDVPPEDHQALADILDQLIAEGKIILTKRGKYMLPEGGAPMISGVLSCSVHGRCGFVSSGQEGMQDIFIKGKHMGGALHGDTVLVRITGYDQGRQTGEVKKIVTRANTSIIGVLEEKRDDFYRVKADDRRLFKKLRISEEQLNGAVPGDRVFAQITRYDQKDERIYGTVTAVLGSADSLQGYMEALILQHGIKTAFDQDTLKQTDAIPSVLSPEDYAGRTDLRDKLIFTIDGDDARDFDDAVSIEQADGNNTLLGVHIADVTHYVSPYCPLDNEAYRRGTSVYLPDRVIPMLPQKLSNGLCSLNPREDRLTLTVFMEINGEGRVQSHRIEQTVIRSCERMTYRNVNLLLSDKDPELSRKYAYLLPTLQQMEKLAETLRKRRFDRGAINFDFPEARISVDDSGMPVSIERAERGVSERMIEEFMLIANETVAEYAFWSELPFIYRVHEAPSDEKIHTFRDFILNFGLSLKGRIDPEHPIHPKALEQLLSQVKGTPEEPLIARTMLRSLMKADYRPQNLGHFGLAAKYYCHFTSPIRRYPDLVIHRILKLFLAGGMDDYRLAEYNGFVRGASIASSEAEVRAELCERDGDDLMKAAYMRQFIGRDFEGVVSGVASFGIFVELENSVEGLIRLENMAGDFFVYDETAMSVQGERTGECYRIGDHIEVMLVKADLPSRRLEFILSKDMSKKLLYQFIDDSEQKDKDAEKKQRPRHRKAAKKRKKHDK